MAEQTIAGIAGTTEKGNDALALEYADIHMNLDGKLIFRSEYNVSNTHEYNVIDLNTITSFRLGGIYESTNKPSTRPLFIGFPYQVYLTSAFPVTSKCFERLPVVVADKIHADILAYFKRHTQIIN